MASNFLKNLSQEQTRKREARMLAANNPAYVYAVVNGTSTASPTTVVKGKAKTEDRKPGQINALGAGDYGASKKTRVGSTLNAAVYNAAGSVSNLFGLLDELDARTKARDEADSARLKAGRDASEKGEDINTRAGGLKKQSEDSTKLFEKRYSELKGAGQKKFDTADKLMQRATEEQNAAKAGLGKLGQGAVDFGIAATQFAGDAFLNALLPGSGLAAMGLRAAGGGSYEARQEGLGLDKQLTTGMKSAAIEVLTEKLFGAGSKVAYGKGLIKNQNVVNGIVNRLAKTDKGRTALKVILAANEEGMEEVLSDILNPIADYALDLRNEDGELLDELTFEQMAEDYIIGTLLGGMGSGGNVISGQYKAENAQQREKEKYQSALTEAAERSGADVQKYKDIVENSGKRGKRTLTDKETAELENIVYSPYVELRLDALSGKSSPETAKAIIKAARGEKLTKAEQKAFDENPYSQRVGNEMTEEGTSNSWYAAMMNNVVYPEEREAFVPDSDSAQQTLERSAQTKDAVAAAVFPNRAVSYAASEIIADLAREQSAAQSIIEEGLSQPEGSAAQRYASRLRKKALEGETITEEETAELNRLLTAPLELEDAEPIAEPRGEALDLVSEEEYDKAQELKAKHAQAMKDGLISERKIYDAIRDGENTEDIIRENARKQLEKEADGLPTETLNAMADYVAAGGKLTTAIETAKNISEEAKNERREQSADNGVGRKPGVDTGEQTGSVQESTRRTEENKRPERGSQETGRKDIPKAHRVSSREIGITNGTNAKTLTIDNNPNATAKRIMAAFEKAANGFVAVKGNIETKQGTVQGVTTADGKVIFRTDHRMYGQTEILLHECGHLYIRDDSDIKKALKEACLESMSEKQLKELALKYGALWQGVMNESMTDEEFFDYALEEIYCDALAGIDRISARGASRLTEAVRGAFEEETGIDVDALLSGTETGETAVTTEKSKAENERPRNNGPPSEDEKYSYAGERARTSNYGELYRAKEMKHNGVNAEEIYNSTGWFIGADGKWRFEIDDSNMEFRKNGDARLLREENYRRLEKLTQKWADSFEGGEALTEAEEAEMEALQNEYQNAVWEEKFMLSDFLKHDKLFDAYPRLNGVELQFDDLPNGVKGFYSKRSNCIVLSDSLFGKEADVLIHEIQHIIQKYEGFSSGANPEYWRQNYDTAKKASIEKVKKRIAALEEKLPAPNEHWTDEADRIVKEIEALEDRILQIENGLLADGMELYRNTAGEIEARDVASRRMLTAEERRNRMPDIGDENTVFADRSHSSMSIEEITDETGRTYGRGVRLDSTLLNDLTDSEREQMVKERAKELGGQHFTAYDNDGNEVDIQIAKPNARFVNKSGKTVPVNKDLTTKKRSSKIKQEAVVLADELITAARHGQDSAAKYPHGWLDNDGKNDWAEWKTYIQDKENTVWVATLHIATSASGEKFLYDIGPIKKAGQSGNSDTSTAGHIIAKREATVKQKLSVDDADGLRVRASRMSVNTLRDRLSRVEGMIRGYEMTEELSEAKQKELDKLKENRDIFKEALEEKKKKAKENRASEAEAGKTKAEKMRTSPTAISNSAENLVTSLLDTFNISGNKAEARRFIRATLAQWQTRGNFTQKDIDHLEDYLLTNGVATVEADDTAAEVRSYIYHSRIYVNPSVVAELGDEWNSLRRRAFGAGIYLTSKDINAGGIDSHYMELQGAFGNIFGEETDLTAMLEQMITMAEDGKAENMSLYDYAKHLERTEHGGDEYIDYMHNKLVEELKAFSKSAKVEMRVKTQSAYAQARDRARRQRLVQEAQERQQLAELQKKTLKQLQYVSRNLRTTPQGELRAEMEKILEGINIITVKTANEMNYSDKYEATWKDLARMYAEAKTNDPNWVPNKELEKIMSRVNDVSLEEMTPDELRALYEAAVALNTNYHNRNNMINDELHRTYADVAASTSEEISAAKKPKNRFGKKAQRIRETLNPIHYLEYLTGWNPDSVFYNTLAKGLENGERKMRRYQEEANQMLDAFLTENKAWNEKADGQGKDGIWYEYDVPELVELKLGQKPVFGETRKIYMTPMQKVMLALESRNYDNLMHMLGGRIFPDKERYQKGDTEEAFSAGTNVKLAPETVKNLVKDLTEQEQALYDILAKYYNDYSKKQINETSNALYGYDKAMSSFYAPITTSKNYTKSTPGKFDMTAEGVGHMKGRIYGAKNPTLNISALEAFRRHVAQTSEFVGLAIPIENLNRTLNWYAGDQTVKGIIAEQWSAKDEKYINDLMEEIQGAKHIPDDAIDKAVRTIESGYIVATFAFNPSVAMKVFGSWFTAMGSLNPKYAINSFKKVDESLVSKYTSELDIRKRGYSTPELARMQAEQGKINKLIQSNKVTKDVFGGGWMVAADVAVAKGLWSWAEAQVMAETDLRAGTSEQVNSGTDEFYKEVARKFEEAIGNTQSMYDTMHRSQIMKQEGITRAFTMFHTDTLQCLNILTKNIGEARHLKAAAAADPENEVLSQRADKAQENVASAINGVVLCSLEVALVSVLNSLLKRRDKFEDEEGGFDWGEAGAEFVTSFLQGFTGMMPGWDVAMNAMVEFALGGKTYDVELPGLSMMNDLLQGGISLAEKIKSGKDLTMEDVKDISLQIAKAAGLPFENIEKYVTGILAWVSPSLAQAYDDMFAAPKKSDLNELNGQALDRAVYDMLKEYRISERDTKELARLYSEGYTKAVAGDVPDSITVDGEKMQLTKEDKEKYRAVMGETLSKISVVLNSAEYKAADDQEKENMLRRVNEFAHATAKKAVNSEYDMPSWAESAQDLIDMGKGIMSVAAMPYSSKKASSSSESEDNRFTQLVKGGVEYNNAADIERTLQDITPSNGKSVRDVDKLAAVAEMPIGEDEKDIAFSIILGSKTYEEYKTAMGAGALSYQYADFRKELDRINDNSAVSQEEFEAAANASNLPAEAAKQMWYARGWKKQSPWG